MRVRCGGISKQASMKISGVPGVWHGRQAVLAKRLMIRFYLVDGLLHGLGYQHYWLFR